MTLQETADKAGIDVGQLSRIERGIGGLSIRSLRRLAKALQLSDLERRLAPFDNDNGAGHKEVNPKTGAAH